MRFTLILLCFAKNYEVLVIMALSVIMGAS